MDLYQENERNRLFRAIESSYRGLEPFRKFNCALVEEYAGNGYGGGNGRPDTYINLMNQAVDAYTMALVANRPRIMTSTQNLGREAFCKRYELAVNHLIEEIGLEYTLRQWVLDAFFCVGIIKCHMADSGLVNLGGDVWMDPGQPFASNVSIDNFVFDMTQKKYSQVRFAGDMYRVPFEDLKQPDLYDQEVVAELQPSSKFYCDTDRLEKISRGWEVDPDEFEPHVDLADIWIPRTGQIWTFAVSNVNQFQLKGKPLAVMPWTGPEGGPYDLLGFNDVPDNIMPTSPASHLSMLSRLVNNLMRKQSRRAKAQRQAHVYSPSGAETAKKIKNAVDDEFIESTEPKDFSTIQVGGVDANTQQLILGTIEMFDRMGGNITAMLGLGAQADTASQEQLIHGAVSKKEASMQYRVVDGAARLIRKLGYMLWTDRFKQIPAKLEIEGAEGYEVDMSWDPDTRDGEFDDYDLNIDLYSMPYSSPSQKIEVINKLVTQIYAPLTQHLVEQGGMIDLQELTELFAGMLNTPQLRKVIKFTSAPPPEPQPEEEGPGMPAVTSRNYTRRNVPTGGTMQGRSQAQQMAWAGRANPQQQASMQRATA